MTDTPTLPDIGALLEMADMVAAVEWRVRQLDSFTKNHPRRQDAPPEPDAAEKELAVWRGLLSTLAAIGPVIEVARGALKRVVETEEDGRCDWPPRSTMTEADLQALINLRDALSSFPAPPSTASSETDND